MIRNFQSFRHTVLLSISFAFYFICFYNIPWQGALNSLSGLRPSYFLFGNKSYYYYYNYSWRSLNNKITPQTIIKADSIQ